MVPRVGTWLVTSMVISLVSCNCHAASTTTEDIESTLWVNWSQSVSNRDFEDIMDLVDKERSNVADVKMTSHVSTEDCLTISSGRNFVAPSISSHHVPTDAFDICKNDANLSRSGSADEPHFARDSIVDTSADSSASFEAYRDVAIDASEIDRSSPEASEIPRNEFSTNQNAEDDGIHIGQTSSTVGTLDKGGSSLQETQLGGHVTAKSSFGKEIATKEVVAGSELLIETFGSQREVPMVDAISKIPEMKTSIFNDENASVERPTQGTEVDAVENVDDAAVSDGNYGRIQQNSKDQSIRRTKDARGECELEGFDDSISITSHLNIRVDDTNMLVGNASPSHLPLPEQLVRSTQNDFAKQSASSDHISSIGGSSRSTTAAPTDYNPHTIQASNEEFSDRAYGYTTIWGRQKEHRMDDNYLYELLRKEAYSNPETKNVVSALDTEIMKDVVGSAETFSSDETHNVEQNFDSTKAPKSVNTEFVEGLDDIDKFLEEVEPPDELDVGAAGSSIQEVLVGQGAQILTKHVTIALARIKNSFKQSRLTNFLASRRTNDGQFRIVTLDELGRAFGMFHRSCKAFVRNIEALWDDLLDDDDDSLNLEIEISHEARKLDSFRQGVLGRVVDDDYDRA
jgi:hypothetical protein